MSKIAILLPDGTGLKNYIFSDLIPKIYSMGSEIMLISDFSDSIIHEVEVLHGITIESVKIPPYRERFKERFIRELEACSRVRRNARVANNRTILNFWVNKGKTFPQRLFYGVISFLSLWYGRGNRVEYLSKRYLSLVRTQDAEELLLSKHIDVLFCTHQRAYSAATLFKAARKLNIGSYTVIYSWDNLPKGRLPFRADYYLVWSEWMKNEFRLYYPDIEMKRVIITGTPQFEFYARKDWLLSREEFCHKIGINPEKRIICYSGDDILSSPYDPQYLDDLAKTLDTFDKNHNTAILLRRCPVDTSGRFNEVINKYPGVIYVSEPLWKRDNDRGWSGLFPSIDDVKLLCNVSYHCDAVYNVGSTMAFDFGMFGHPAYYINYNVVESKTWSIKTINSFQHFRSMPSKDCVIWVNDRDNLGQLMRTFVSSDGLIITNIKKWYEIINSGAIDGLSSERIAESLTQI